MQDNDPLTRVREAIETWYGGKNTLRAEQHGTLVRLYDDDRCLTSHALHHIKEEANVRLFTIPNGVDYVLLEDAS